MAEIILNDTYRKYFEHQATAHPDLQHGTGGNVFATINVEEALGDFRAGAKEKGFIFRLINYFFSIGDNGAHETRKEINGGFIIAHYHSPRTGGVEQIYEALRKSEKVGDEIIEKMITDSRNGHPLFGRSFDSNQDVTAQPVTSVGDNYSGYRYIFKFSNHWRNCITAAEAPAWTDGGTTPHDLG